MRSLFLVALCMSGLLLVVADSVSVSGELVASVPVDDVRVSKTATGLLRPQSPALVEGYEERLSNPFQGLSGKFINWLKSIFAKLRDRIFGPGWKEVSEFPLGVWNALLMRDAYPNLLRESGTRALYSDLLSHKVDVRRATAAHAVLSTEFWTGFEQFVAGRHDSTSSSMFDALRKYLSEFELAILISRAMAEKKASVQASAIAMANMQFNAWKVHNISPKGVREAFTNGRPLLPKSGEYREPSPFQAGDEEFVKDIVRAYAGHLGSHERALVRVPA